MAQTDKFWLEDPTALFRERNIIPSPGQTYNQKLNALTRLAILIAIVLFFFPLGSFWMFLVGALIIIIILYYLNKNNNNNNNNNQGKVENKNFQNNFPGKVENLNCDCKRKAPPPDRPLIRKRSNHLLNPKAVVDLSKIKITHY
jgi:hypothetical protein